MTYVGLIHVYFNSHGAAPLVWCVGVPGLFELAIAAVVIDAPANAVYKPKPTPDDEDGRPSAWFEVNGALRIVEGRVAIIERAPREEIVKP